MEEVKRKYYDNGKIYEERYYKRSLLHRDEGPAVIWYYEDGSIEEEDYYKNGKLHRLDGPAMIRYDEDGKKVEESYYIKGEEYKDIFQYLVVAGSC
jgi:antitoxin component YwqK of YwqJK toxin-antitoxin module